MRIWNGVGLNRGSESQFDWKRNQDPIGRKVRCKTDGFGVQLETESRSDTESDWKRIRTPIENGVSIGYGLGLWLETKLALDTESALDTDTESGLDMESDWKRISTLNRDRTLQLNQSGHRSPSPYQSRSSHWSQESLVYCLNPKPLYTG